MRTLGLLGGRSWARTAEYYRLINRGVAERLGGLHSARLLMHRVDFAEVAEMQRSGNWRAAGAALGGAGAGVRRAGWGGSRGARTHWGGCNRIGDEHDASVATDIEPTTLTSWCLTRTI